MAQKHHISIQHYCRILYRKREMVRYAAPDFSFKIIYRSVKSNLIQILRFVLQPKISGSKSGNILSLNPHMLICSYNPGLPGSFLCHLLPAAVSAPVAAGNGKNGIFRRQIHIIGTIIGISHINISSIHDVIAGYVPDGCIGKKCRPESGGNTHHINNSRKYQ